jgi:hypothetical protein
MQQEFVHEGVKYRYIGDENKVRLSKSAMSVIGIAAMFGGSFSTRGIRGLISDSQLYKLRQVDIISEYFLIQKKQSKLSSNERKWVVKQFNRSFKKVEYVGEHEDREYTKEEALELMEKGIKITHESFTSDEWMTIEKGKILLEDGVRCSRQEFWHWRREKYWNTGYYIFKEK